MIESDKMPALNEQFCVIAAVTPQIMQWELVSYYHAGSSVEAATTQSRHHVKRKWWTCGVVLKGRIINQNIWI
jgi:hypothetical protein